MGIAYLGIGTGFALVPQIAAGLEKNLGWHLALSILGILIVLIALPLAFFVKDSPPKTETTLKAGPPVSIISIFKNPNFYLDTSGYGHDRVGVLEYAVKTIGSDRILFGSDFSINDPSTVIARIRNSFLTMEQKQKILSGNILELLKKFEKT